MRENPNPQILKIFRIVRRDPTHSSKYFLVGQVPFVGENAVQIYENIIRGQIDFPQSVRDAEGDIQYIQVSPWARDIITGLLKVDRTRRLGNMRNGAQDVQNHPWVGISEFDIFFRVNE